MSGDAKRATASPRNVAHAIVIKDEDVFLMSEHGGGIPAGNQDGFGLYYHDCRFLNGYSLEMAGTKPNPLVSNADRGSIADFEMTNEKLQLADGNLIQAQTFGIRLQRAVDGQNCAVRDVYTFDNYDVVDHELPLCLRFKSDFEDIFEIRGLHPAKRGRQNEPEWHDGVLALNYAGADGVSRKVEVHIDPGPDAISGAEAQFSLRLRAKDQQQIKVSLRIAESKGNQIKTARDASEITHLSHFSTERSEKWLSEHAELHTDNPYVNDTVRRCLLDLLMLNSSLEGCEFFAAGLPWYGTLFGRDSIVAAIETLAFEPRIAVQTIRLLAKFQGTKTDEWRDEQPGKILHELRRGELANLNEIPQTPYYGSVDSTPLFLILIGEHANWTGNLSIFNEFRPNVERAIKWIDEYGDEARNGYLSYATKSSKGLKNQGWKDSDDAITNADGSIAKPPIALAEVQGYVYVAKLLIADLYSRSGDHNTAQRLRSEAQELKTRFNREFWLKDKDYYAMALQKEKRPAAVIGSNPGQALWSGIIDEDNAAAVVRHLMAADMFSGWGIRTLSLLERRANPVGYHLGSVWPHDNAIIAAGLHRYGFDDEAIEVLDGIVQAASHFEHYRLPEVFAGFSRREFPVPVRYPIACHPQAWAAGSVPFLITSVLGIVPDAFNGCIRIVRPSLPRSVKELHFRRIKLGTGSADILFRRATAGTVEVDTRITGNVRVEVDHEPRTNAA